MSFARLLTAPQLAERLSAPELRILDCRFALDDPAYGRTRYAAGHVPGAQFADLERDLSGPIIKGVTGRHPLPDPARLQEALRAWGVDQDSTIVLYDDGPGAFAARAWWLLAWLGKRDGVFLLDGGFQAWQAAGLPVTAQVTEPARGDFTARPDACLVVEADQLGRRLAEPGLTLIDARALPRFRGEVEPLDPVAGHIPGARCAPFTDNLGADGRFLPPEQLRQRFENLLAGRNPEQLVAYCGSGVTACHNLFALSLAGLPLAPLYAGSWSEWITDPARPVARGD
ncbi:sulfurtransferase [Pseudomonas flexibilis]|uniref:Sulfurtransferase n=1 Tax=Pseudomonas flexibilis TaxID=706570 RepID=A0A0B3C3T0_9PSED|nr:sulfurtransferase [Pseudomonas flexibilis]KHO66147.1 3-mercaptopyruvate sulfurtransferase [Pseudomonas flexibilis]SCY44823.1 thiosulfate/3-mercaptopyruvate sulfurtransferase [Pseudomonas flexibilis]